jgi:molybdate transport system substrate-binding protein
MGSTANEHVAAEPLTGISSMATRHVLAELTEAWERQTGHRVEVESVGGVDAAKRVEAGEAFDFVVLAAQAIDRLAEAGYVDAWSRVDVARSGAAIAVAAGARRPDLSSEQAVWKALLAARSIGYSTGPSGAHLTRLLQRWGIAETVAPRLVKAPPGVAVGGLVARGEAEIGFQQMSEFIHVRGIDIAGALPPEIQEVTVFQGAVCAASARSAAARVLLLFLASSETAAVKRAHGMEP